MAEGADPRQRVPRGACWGQHRAPRGGINGPWQHETDRAPAATLRPQGQRKSQRGMKILNYNPVGCTAS